MNKLALLVKDEEGMTLVELLAVIVILSIVAAIGGVAIAGVIQRSREDARVADVQMLLKLQHLPNQVIHSFPKEAQQLQLMVILHNL